MDYWKKNVNYKQIKEADGRISYLIKIADQLVEVDEKIYREYAGMERRERYLVEREADMQLSLEQFAEDELSGEYLRDNLQENVEDIVLDRLDAEERAELVGALHTVLPQLAKSERDLINALYFDAVPVREYARRRNLTHRAIQKQRDRILEKIRNLLFCSKSG